MITTDDLNIIEGYVARDKDDNLWLYKGHPARVENNFNVFFKRYHNKNVYYRGVEGRGNDVIEALKKIGARNAGCFSGNYGKCLYFIKENGYIDTCADDSLVADILQRGFTELFLPEIETVEIDGKKFRKDEVIEKINGLKEIK